MCSHYDPVLDYQTLKTYFSVEDALPLDLKDSVWPAYMAPFIRKHEHADVGDDAVPRSELLIGSFGMVPHWAKDIKIARTRFNARSETVHELNTFKDSWNRGRHCIIPANAIWEPDWRTKKHVPTRIVRADGKPMGIAGIWTSWRKPEGDLLHSFTMLTINADDHQFMRDFHKEDQEKRMVVILQDEDYDAWLEAPVESSRQFLKQFPAENMLVSQR